ncbi:1,4-alpha-glucan branching protein domain-containing protein [Paenibacillus sp. OSY-SE]|uniref:1,4-alpha-glucan branching protein domain-containing protein n=1 Tax=Paenibacillus sp. OSY-SE TaxID=1196323 RepID=UPI0002E8FF93|nr:1,4-alpha-glucan branching protein domain-containing protein [Paenibacillus sp. OSY-SE]
MKGTILYPSDAPMQNQGQIALILHAHLPYVRHPHRPNSLEERWFFEAMMETYLPLIDVFRRLEQDNVPFRITMTLSPTLLSMMEDKLMQSRFEEHLKTSIRLARSETKRLRTNNELQNVAALYLERWLKWLHMYRQCGGRVIEWFRHFVQKGWLECITCAATHAFLPLIKHPVLAHAQIEIGAREHERLLGQRPEGIWLPECAYSPELSPLLQASGIRYFMVDHHGLLTAQPQPHRLQYAPAMTEDGVFAFARDPESSHQVWSSYEGYPGDCDYREYYRDIGFDLGWNDEAEWNYIRPYILEDGARLNTGMKYYRITGAGSDKTPYRLDWALHKVREHAKHFLDSRERQLVQAQSWMDRAPIVVCPYDAELFGHWWFEGPLWVEALFREQHARGEQHEQRTKFVAPSDYIAAYPDSEQTDLTFSSWGRGGYADVWLQERNDWIYKHLHHAEDRLLQYAQRLRDSWGFRPVQERIMNMALKEWMLAASSDWAFILDAGTVTEYAAERTRQHLGRCHLLLDMLEQGVYDLIQLEKMEAEYPCFKTADYRLLLPDSSSPRRTNMPFYTVLQPLPPPPSTSPKAKVTLMLAWEFPPLIVGGLSRAVYDLSRHLAEKQCEVHVVTREVPDAPSYELMNGVHVHRVALIHSVTPIDFMDWVFQMNAAMSDGVDALVSRGLTFDFLHAHDWLVYPAAQDIKSTFGCPLIVTIHATEHGRNHGRIQGELPQRIHQMEYQLTEEAEHVIVCSHSMVQEVEQIFSLPRRKITMIPNGVEIRAESAAIQILSGAAVPASEPPLLFYVGRLVFEKGIHVLIEAMPRILQSVPDAKLIIAGTGPMKQELEGQVQAMNLGEQVHFAGFVQDDTRDALIQSARVCVFPSLYEPFGIVALEAMRFGTPVVVSDTGGLAEIVDHGVDGYKALPGHIESLAWHVTDMLLHPEHAAEMAATALYKVRTQYDWNTIAVSTRQVYEGVIAR